MATGPAYETPSVLARPPRQYNERHSINSMYFEFSFTANVTLAIHINSHSLTHSIGWEDRLSERRRSSRESSIVRDGK